jgi:hypothetical protein
MVHLVPLDEFGQETEVLSNQVDHRADLDALDSRLCDIRALLHAA